MLPFFIVLPNGPPLAPISHYISQSKDFLTFCLPRQVNNARKQEQQFQQRHVNELYLWQIVRFLIEHTHTHTLSGLWLDNQLSSPLCEHLYLWSEFIMCPCGKYVLSFFWAVWHWGHFGDRQGNEDFKRKCRRKRWRNNKQCWWWLWWGGSQTLTTGVLILYWPTSCSDLVRIVC